jgi:transmembrane sensor
MRQEPLQPDWEMLGRYLTGESDAGEVDAVRRWIAADPRRGDLLATLDLSTRLSAAPAVDVEAALRRVRARFEEPEVIALPVRAAWRPVAFAAAAALMLLVGATLLWQAIRGRSPAPVAPARDYATAVGQLDSVQLSDGSRIVLAPGSRVHVAAGYGGQARSLELEGEALFEVRHDAARPFTVRSGGAEITDLGTRFTVRSNAEGVEVVVSAGSVSMRDTTRGAPRGVTLTAGSVGTLSKAQQQPAVRRAAPAEQQASWTSHRLVFDNVPLARVRDDLRRWYGLTLQVADSTLLARHLKAEFTSETPQQVLDVIALALGAVIERRGDTATIRLRSARTRSP